MNLPLRNTTVAILCGHFMPEVGYQEVELANAFARLGARVIVITSSAVSPGSRRIVPGDYEPGRATRGERTTIYRLKPTFQLGPNVIAKGVEDILKVEKPDVCILVGPGKLFGVRAFSKAIESARVSIFQENSQDGRHSVRSPWKRFAKAAVHRLLKRPAYARVIASSDRVVCNVPETKTILHRWLRKVDAERFNAKRVDLRLGFDPGKFRYCPDARDRFRKKLHVDESEILIGTCTRATPTKNLEGLLEDIRKLREAGLPVRYVLAGVMEDDYGSRLRETVSRQFPNGEVTLLPVLAHDEMNEFFCAADLGVWTQAAITIQQAMGTGLTVVLNDHPNVSHLLRERQNGWYIKEATQRIDVLADAVQSIAKLPVALRQQRRQEIAKLNYDYLSYDRIATEMLTGLLPFDSNGTAGVSVTETQTEHE